MTAHEATASGRGFGETTRRIKGALACDKPGDTQVARKLGHGMVPRQLPARAAPGARRRPGGLQ